MLTLTTMNILNIPRRSCKSTETTLQISTAMDLNYFRFLTEFKHRCFELGRPTGSHIFPPFTQRVWRLYRGINHFHSVLTDCQNHSTPKLLQEEQPITKPVQFSILFYLSTISNTNHLMRNILSGTFSHL